MTTKAPQAPQPAADAPGTAVGQAGPRRAGEYPENTAAAGVGGRSSSSNSGGFSLFFC